MTRSAKLPIVVDSSAMVEMLVRAPRAAMLQEMIGVGPAHAPASIDMEALRALEHLDAAGKLGDAGAERCLELLYGAPVERHPVAPLVGGAWARRAAVPLAAGLYLELVLRLGGELLTTDPELAKAAAGVVPLAPT